MSIIPTATVNRTVTLAQLLMTQDYGYPHALKLIQSYQEGIMDAEKDPLSYYIIDRWMKGMLNDNLADEAETFITDLEYAIDQLKKVKNVMEG